MSLNRPKDLPGWHAALLPRLPRISTNVLISFPASQSLTLFSSILLISTLPLLTLYLQAGGSGCKDGEAGLAN